MGCLPAGRRAGRGGAEGPPSASGRVPRRRAADVSTSPAGRGGPDANGRNCGAALDLAAAAGLTELARPRPAHLRATPPRPLPASQDSIRHLGLAPWPLCQTALRRGEGRSGAGRPVRGLGRAGRGGFGQHCGLPPRPRPSHSASLRPGLRAWGPGSGQADPARPRPEAGRKWAGSGCRRRAAAQPPPRAC